MQVKAYGVTSVDSPVLELTINRRDLRPNDVMFKVLYSGICHSDIHTARGDWGEIPYHCVPGHEIVGEVTGVGSEVTKYKIGDKVGVGCMVDTCRECAACKNGFEQYCEKDPIWTYSSTDPKYGSITMGGYSELMVADQDFVLKMPENLDLSKVAPLLCAGITMYSPLKQWNTGSGKKVAILGLGGLGHMGLKIAKAMGAEVDVITSSPSKIEIAQKYGADNVVLSSDLDQMKQAYRKYDLVLDTNPGKHDLNPYLELVAINGTLCLVGPIATMFDFNGSTVMGGRKSISGSGIGSVAETAEMLEFCAENNILPEVEEIKPDMINQAWENMQAKKVSHRYVIKMTEI